MTTDNEMAQYEEPDSALDVATAAPSGKSAGEYRAQSVASALDTAYGLASTLQLTSEEADALGEDFPDDAFRLGAGGDPDLIYIEHAYLRQRLNQVLGVGASVPLRRREWSEAFTYLGRDRKRHPGIRIYVDLVLLVRGCVVGEAIGDSVYYPDNAKTNYSDALESAKSNAFRRCCKEFGIGLQAWMKGWGEGWKQRNGGGGQPEQPAHTKAKSKPAATPAPPVKPAEATKPPVSNFKIPPGWPETTLEEVQDYIEEINTSAWFVFANNLMFGDDSPFISMNEREPLITQLHTRYHKILDPKTDEVKAAVAHITDAIDSTMTKLQLDKEALGTF